MNKRINQLINQLHLDPKKEAAVREIVENVGSNNQSGGNNSGGNEPVIIEYPNGSNEEIAVTDEQIEAVKNGNVKIKLTMTGTTNYIILAPISITIMEEVAEIVVRSYFGENITDAILLVDFTNKTISIPV